jgi:hypothetical protein
MELTEPFVAFQNGLEASPVLFLMFSIFIFFLLLIVLIIKAVIYCKVFSKAGYCWALGLLMFVPIVNIIMPFVLAFADWPIHKELRSLKQQLGKPPV